MIKRYKDAKTKRAIRTRHKIGEGLRLSVFRSHKQIYAQIIDDKLGKTIVTASSKDIKKEDAKDKNKIELAHMVGETLGDRAKTKGVTKLNFDRGSYKYHGRVKALAVGAREKGLKF